MKSIAADSLFMQRAGEREPRGDLGLVMVKGGIEAGDLGKVRRQGCNGADRGQIVRLVERRKRAERVEFGEKVGIDAARCGETHPAMHDAVPDRDHFPAFEVIDGPVEQILEEFRMRQAGALCPCALDQDAPINPARD